MYPTAQHYIDLLTKKRAQDSLASKWGVELVYDSSHTPVFHIGTHGIVFKIRELKSGKYRAYKFFIKDQYRLLERYSKIASFRKGLTTTYMPRIVFREEALTMKTDNGKTGKFPVLLMDWIEGERLNDYILRIKSSPCELADLFCKFMKLASWLIQNGFVHGDLQPENILIDSNGNLVLVDFDNFRLSSTKEFNSNHDGANDYAHPDGRSSGNDIKYCDDFTISLLALSLRAIVIDNTLLNSYNGTGGILLSEKDLKDISESNILKKLFPSLDPILDELYGIFLKCYNDHQLPISNFLSVVERCDIPVYLNSTPTKREKKYSIKDELGAVYSSDGLKLIKFNGFRYGHDQKVFEPNYGCMTICNKAFDRNAFECKIIIPESIRQIGVNALPKCTIENQSPHFTIENQSLYTHDKTRLLNIFNCESSLYEIPEETRVIDEGAIPSEAAPYFIKLHDVNIQIDPSDSILVVETEEQKDKLLAGGVRDGQIYVGDVLLDTHNVLYSLDCHSLLCFPRESRLKSYEIHEDCENIEPFAFPNIPDPDDDGSMFYIGNYLLMITFPKNLKSIADYSLLGMTDLRVARYNKSDEDNVFKLLDSYKDAFVRPFRERVTMIPDRHYTERQDSDFDNCIEDSKLVQYSQDQIKLIGTIIGEHGTYRVDEHCRIICDGSFENTVFEEIIIPDSVEAIGELAFENSEVRKIKIGSGVKAIEDNAFAGCKNLKYVALPSGLYYTGDEIFKDCLSLQYIVIPASLLRLDIDNIPSSVSEIYIEEGSIFFNKLYEDSRFSHKIRLFTSTTALPHEFEDCIEVGNVLYSNDGKRILSINGIVESLIIPEGVETICDEAFNDLTNTRNEGGLETLVLPSTLKNIGRNAFCGSIFSIESNSPMFVCEDDMLLSKDKHTLYYYYGDWDGEFFIRDTINKIWSGAFISRKITSVKNTGSIYELGDNPFLDVFSDDNSGRGIVLKGDYYGNYRAGHNCLFRPRYWGEEPSLIGYYGAESILDLRDMDLGHIQKYAFFGCLIEKIYLPSSIKFIHREAFEWCFELRRIIVDKGQSDRFKLILPANLGKYVIEEDFSSSGVSIPDDDLPF